MLWVFPGNRWQNHVRVDPSIHQEISFETFQSNTGWLVLKIFANVHPEKLGKVNPFWLLHTFLVGGLVQPPTRRIFHNSQVTNPHSFRSMFFFLNRLPVRGLRAGFLLLRVWVWPFFQSRSRKSIQTVVVCRCRVEGRPKGWVFLFFRDFSQWSTMYYIWYIWGFLKKWRDVLYMQIWGDWRVRNSRKFVHSDSKRAKDMSGIIPFVN